MSEPFNGMSHHEAMTTMQLHVEAGRDAKPMKPGQGWVLHLIATLMTGGLWLPVWIYFAYAKWKKGPASAVAAPLPDGDTTGDAAERIGPR